MSLSMKLVKLRGSSLPPASWYCSVTKLVSISIHALDMFSTMVAGWDASMARIWAMSACLKEVLKRVLAERVEKRCPSPEMKIICSIELKLSVHLLMRREEFPGGDER